MTIRPLSTRPRFSRCVRVLLTLVFLAVPAAALAQDEQTGEESTAPDVRNTWWGASPGEVKESESLTLDWEETDGNESTVAYRDAFSGIPCSIEYLFNHDALVGVMYDYDGEYGVPEGAPELFDQVRSALAWQYGTPADTEEVRDGAVIKQAFWDTPTAYVTLYLAPEDPDIGFGVLFSSGDALTDEQEQIDAATDALLPAEPADGDSLTEPAEEDSSDWEDWGW